MNKLSQGIALLLLIIAVRGQGLTTVELELYTSDNDIGPGDAHVLLANLNCSNFQISNIVVAVNLPNFLNPVSQALLFLSTQPSTIGNYQPYPDPNYPTTWSLTTFVNYTSPPLANVSLPGSNAQILYITMVCANPPCEYNVAITQADSLTSVTSKNFNKPIVKYFEKVNTVIQKNFMLRNRMIQNGAVLYGTWANTVTVPICPSTLSNIYGPNTQVCLEVTVVGKTIGCLFYQQICLLPYQNENVPKWYVRPINVNEPVRDLTGTFKLPVNRYRTLPIPLSQLQNIPQVYQNVAGEGGEGWKGHLNEYFTIFEWFQCDN